MRQVYLGFVFVALIFAGCNFEVNKSIEIGNDEHVQKNLFTVNGSIRIGKRCQVKGDCRVVNGSITINDDSQARDLNSINGKISLGKKVTIRGDAVTINGAISSEPGTVISGDVSSINGEVDLHGTEVGKDIITKSGDVILRNKSIVRGDIRVDKSGMINDNSSRLYVNIRLTDDSVVEGDIIVEEKDREVTVDLRGGGKVLGEIRNAEVLR